MSLTPSASGPLLAEEPAATTLPTGGSLFPQQPSPRLQGSVSKSHRWRTCERLPQIGYHFGHVRDLRGG